MVDATSTAASGLFQAENDQRVEPNRHVQLQPHERPEISLDLPVS